MTQLEKLYQRALTSPGSVRFRDLERLLLRHGFTCRQPGGGSSHYVFERGHIMLTIPRQGNNGVKPVYVRRAMGALADLRADDVLEASDEDDEGEDHDGTE
ncbi:MAG: type II toxin-antitoxin system HicA family toxin [Dehalococcoidia bacterium]